LGEVKKNLAPSPVLPLLRAGAEGGGVAGLGRGIRYSCRKSNAEEVICANYLSKFHADVGKMCLISPKLVRV
jgi:hypothetical protein